MKLLALLGLFGATASTGVPSIPLAPGVNMPLVGIGTWQYNETLAETVVEMAIKAGYRHIDTALGYNNQVGVGKAIATAIDTMGVSREDLFVVSKIPGGLNVSDAAQNLDLAVSQLFPGVDDGYVDLMLVHYPATWGGKGGKAARQEEWKAMEAAFQASKARALGVSHYCRKHLDDILEIATIKPVLNQVQYHVGMGSAGPNATDNKEYMKQKGVTFEGFSPLCGPCDAPDNKALITGPLVTKIGKKYGKSGPQVALRWQVQQGIPVIPKTSNPVHMAENFDIFSFNLSDEDMAALSAATSPHVAGSAEGGSYVSGDCDVL